MIILKSIPIPGLTTFSISAPNVSILGNKDTELRLTLSYHFYRSATVNMDDKPRKRLGEISFAPLIGFRFSWAEFMYDEFPEITLAATAERTIMRQQGNAIRQPGLDEIINSPYTEHMLSTNRYSHLADRMGEGGIKETDVKHYRISFDEYGHFDILALGVSTTEYEK